LLSEKSDLHPKNFLPIFLWAQAAPTRYSDRGHWPICYLFLNYLSHKDGTMHVQIKYNSSRDQSICLVLVV